MRSVEALAQIRLNLSGVDQFLAIACGLADDNPDIKERVYEAANEVRSAAQLIDHLRNLFSHQTSVEREQVVLEHCAGYGSASRRSTDPNAQLFTYSNQLTLVRASKCLVANVATILYLTDSILPQGHLQPSNHGHQQQVSTLMRELAGSAWRRLLAAGLPSSTSAPLFVLSILCSFTVRLSNDWDEDFHSCNLSGLASLPTNQHESVAVVIVLVGAAQSGAPEREKARYANGGQKESESLRVGELES